jgi:hypothetical protein
MNDAAHRISVAIVSHGGDMVQIGMTKDQEVDGGIWGHTAEAEACANLLNTHEGRAGLWIERDSAKYGQGQQECGQSDLFHNTWFNARTVRNLSTVDQPTLGTASPGTNIQSNLGFYFLYV